MDSITNLQGSKTLENAKKNGTSKSRLRFRLLVTMIVLLVMFASFVGVTFAWYVYQTGARTSDIRMAVGTGSTLQISNQYDGSYGNSTVMDVFRGALVPVSTNSIINGFQKVTDFTDAATIDKKKAYLFGAVDTTEYYKTTLYLRVGGEKQTIYLSDIGYEDDDPANPISTAIRMGFVVHKAGLNQPVDKEYIFAINGAANPKANYNTATGEEGYVLDSTKTDGTTIPFTNLYTSDHFCNYDPATGAVTLKEKSLPMLVLEGGADKGYGTPVQVDVYVWLEGCDKDCYNNICGKMLTKIALSFAGKMVEE